MVAKVVRKTATEVANFGSMAVADSSVRTGKSISWYCDVPASSAQEESDRSSLHHS
jgi:hypothetical protein